VQLCKRCAVSARRKSCSFGAAGASVGGSEATRVRQGFGVVKKTNRSFGGKGINDFFEARVAAERVPEGQKF
jgi:hypothetical protein